MDSKNNGDFKPFPEFDDFFNPQSSAQQPSRDEPNRSNSYCLSSGAGGSVSVPVFYPVGGEKDIRANRGFDCTSGVHKDDHQPCGGQDDGENGEYTSEIPPTTNCYYELTVIYKDGSSATFQFPRRKESTLRSHASSLGDLCADMEFLNVAKSYTVSLCESPLQVEKDEEPKDKKRKRRKVQRKLDFYVDAL